MYFDKFIGIDWSGDKNSFQKGISVAECSRGNKTPNIVKPPNHKYWTRSTLIKWLCKEIRLQRNLIGFDFAFSYPFMKRITYWPQLFLGLTFNWGIVTVSYTHLTLPTKRIV